MTPQVGTLGGQLGVVAPIVEQVGSHGPMVDVEAVPLRLDGPYSLHGGSIGGHQALVPGDGGQLVSLL